MGFANNVVPGFLLDKWLQEVEQEKVDGLEILYAIQSTKTWYDWNNSRNLVTTPVGTVRNIAQYDGGFEAEGSDYGFGLRGWEGESWFVLEVHLTKEDYGPPRYFKKFGTVDSYGQAEWNGKFIEVFPKTVEAVVYE